MLHPNKKAPPSRLKTLVINVTDHKTMLFLVEAAFESGAAADMPGLKPLKEALLAAR